LIDVYEADKDDRIRNWRVECKFKQYLIYIRFLILASFNDDDGLSAIQNIPSPSSSSKTFDVNKQ